MRSDLNIVGLTGVLARDPTIRFDTASGTPRCTATLCGEDVDTSGGLHKLFVPLEAWGKPGEALGELHAGALVVVQGKLCWRKAAKPQEKGTLAVLVGKVSVLAAPAQPPAARERQGARTDLLAPLRETLPVNLPEGFGEASRLPALRGSQAAL